MKPVVKNIYNHAPWDKFEEQFTTLFQGKMLRIEKILSAGHSAKTEEWYDQEDEEFVLLIEGEAHIEFENEGIIKMAAGDFCNIAAHQKHRVTYTSKNPQCLWIAIHGKITE